jgi:molybdopterin-containing oxidoreductase family membrane subunit
MRHAKEPNSKEPSYAQVNDDIIRTLLVTGPRYYLALGTALLVSIGCFLLPWFYQLKTGIGLSGMNQPNVWGSYLANFIFWIGLSHSGTLLSAVLHITQSSWRNAIYRSAEAMTLFSLITAALFVFVHLGRPWFIHWTLPYPNQMELWPNFRSPLLYDVTAITAYLTASSLFLYIGALPDFAATRDRVCGWRKNLYSLLSLGWRGTDMEWHRLGIAYTFLAVLVIPLAVSVHSVVSWDFALSIVPGLHHTVFAPYFVVGAIYSGTAGIVTMMFFLRKYFSLEDYITPVHFNNLGKLLLLLSLLWTYINGLEIFTGWYSGSSAQIETLNYKLFGYYAPMFWSMILFCTFLPLVLIAKKVRTSLVPMLIISIFINIGMYFERLLILATSLSRKYLPDYWGFYTPSLLEVSIFIGSLGVFISFFLIFVKIVPSVSIYEVKQTLDSQEDSPEDSQDDSPDDSADGRN